MGQTRSQRSQLMQFGAVGMRMRIQEAFLLDGHADAFLWAGAAAAAVLLIFDFNHRSVLFSSRSALFKYE